MWITTNGLTRKLRMNATILGYIHPNGRIEACERKPTCELTYKSQVEIKYNFDNLVVKGTY